MRCRRGWCARFRRSEHICADVEGEGEGEDEAEEAVDGGLTGADFVAADLGDVEVDLVGEDWLGESALGTLSTSRPSSAATRRRVNGREGPDERTAIGRHGGGYQPGTDADRPVTREVPFRPIVGWETQWR